MNTDGGFRCDCNAGFQLDQDNTNCSGMLIGVNIGDLYTGHSIFLIVHVLRSTLILLYLAVVACTIKSPYSKQENFHGFETISGSILNENMRAWHRRGA